MTAQPANVRQLASEIAIKATRSDRFLEDVLDNVLDPPQGQALEDRDRRLLRDLVLGSCRRQVTLVASRDTALAIFQDPGGRATVTAGIVPDQTAGFSVAGPGATSRIQLALRGDGTADLVVSDPAGTITTVP